jgi:hypothetical protein
MRTLPFALAPTLALAALPALAQAPPRPPAHESAAHHADARPPAPVSREALEALEAQLDRAVARVSLPRAAHLLGAGSARGYRLPGYGIVFVLTPRALPGGADHLLGIVDPQRMKVRRPRSAGPEEIAPEIDALERQVIVLQQETELTRRAAEVEMDRIVQNVRVRLAPQGETMHVEVRTEPEEAPPAPLAVESLPVPPPPPAPVAAPESPQAALPPAPPEAPLPPPAPWRYWFETRVPHDERTADTVVADVRNALVDALVGQAGRLPGLGPDEFVTVAVDFEAGGLIASHARPERTLVLRARVRDLDARARGAISPEELRGRLELSEY